MGHLHELLDALVDVVGGQPLETGGANGLDVERSHGSAYVDGFAEPNIGSFGTQSVGTSGRFTSEQMDELSGIGRN